MADNVVEKLTEMLDLAKAGRLTNLAYHYEIDGTSKYGFLNLTGHGQLVVSARLSALAIDDCGGESGKG